MEAAEKGMTIAMIEARRRKADVSIDMLCREAGMSSRSYYYLTSGKVQARPDTLRRLTRALEIARRR